MNSYKTRKKVQNQRSILASSRQYTKTTIASAGNCIARKEEIKQSLDNKWFCQSFKRSMAHFII